MLKDINLFLEWIQYSLKKGVVGTFAESLRCKCIGILFDKTMKLKNKIIQGLK